MLRWSSCFGLLKQGTQIHALVYKREFQDDIIVTTALIGMYCKLGSLKHVRKIFNGVCVKDLFIIGISQNEKLFECFGEY